MLSTGLRYFFAYDADIPPGLGVPSFSPTHWAWLSVTLLLIALAALAYRRASEPGRQRALRVAAVVLVALEVARTVWSVSIGHYHVERMLPLHLCGISVFVEAAAVFTGRRVLKEFSYAVGMPGAFMALVTPEPSATRSSASSTCSPSPDMPSSSSSPSSGWWATASGPTPATCPGSSGSCW